jgi:hypothetical protein
MPGRTGRRALPTRLKRPSRCGAGARGQSAAPAVASPELRNRRVGATVSAAHAAVRGGVPASACGYGNSQSSSRPLSSFSLLVRGHESRHAGAHRGGPARTYGAAFHTKTYRNAPRLDTGWTPSPALLHPEVHQLYRDDLAVALAEDAQAGTVLLAIV